MARRTILADAPGLRRAARAVGVLWVALAVIAGGAVAASATEPTTTTSTSTTSTTVVPPTTPPTTVALLPPPPPFPLGDDFGRLLLLRRTAAIAALKSSTSDIGDSSRLVELATENLKVAQDAQAQAREHARAVVRRLVSVRAQIRALAADAYMMGSSQQFTGTLQSFASARSVVELSRNLTFTASSNDRLMELVDLERREERRASELVDAATKTLTTAEDQSQTATAGLLDAQQRRTTALADISQVQRDQTRFFNDATTSASPIMGPTLLTADDLVAYITSLGLHPKLTVPLRTLAGWYITEGRAEGVRGDVAFAQSILETGAFMFPGHGLLVPTDNNFAGIGACDSCKHGDIFASARIGVRAQIQLLRIYADPTVKKITDLAHGLALLKAPKLGFSGHRQTWYSLGGSWATGPNYGFHVYDIYLKMVALAARK